MEHLKRELHDFKCLRERDHHEYTRSLDDLKVCTPSTASQCVFDLSSRLFKWVAWITFVDLSLNWQT